MEEIKSNPITEAKEVLSKLEEQNLKMELNLDRAERLKAEELMGGKADAGSVPPPPPVETAQEYARRIMAGKL